MRLLILLLTLAILGCATGAGIEKAWPKRFTEVRAIIPDNDGLLAAVGAANEPLQAELWRYNDKWTLVHGWPGRARILDAVRHDGNLCVALAASHRENIAEVQCYYDGEWRTISPWRPGEWGMVKKLLVHDGDLYAFLMHRAAATSSAIWRLHKGKWAEVPAPFDTEVYTATIFQGRLVVGTLPAALWIRDAESWQRVRDFPAAMIQSFTLHNDALYFTLGQGQNPELETPVWAFNGEVLTPLPKHSAWAGNNNFNASTVYQGKLTISTANRQGATSIWQYADGWRQLPGPSLGTGRQHWIYDLQPVRNGLAIGFAGHEGAAQIRVAQPD